MTSAPRKRFHRRWWFRIPVGLILALLIADLVIRKIDRDSLAEAIAEADRLYPKNWRMEDLIARIPPTKPEHHEAVAAVRRWSGGRVGKATDRLRVGVGRGNPNELLDPEQIRNLREAVENRPEVFDELDRVSHLREVTWQPQGDDLVEAVHSEVASVRFLAQGHLFRGYLAINAGRQDEAILRFQSMLNLESWLNSVPHWISQIERMAIQREAIYLLEKIINLSELSVESLEKFGPMLERELKVDSIRLATPSFADDMDRELRSEEMQQARLDRDFLLARYFGNRHRGNSIRHALQLRQALEEEGLTGGEAIRRMDELELRRREQADDHFSWKGVPPFAFPQRFLRDIVAFRNRTQAARLALAVERFRLTEKRLPENLTDLVPRYISSVPADDRTGEAPEFRRLPDRFMVLYPGDLRDKSRVQKEGMDPKVDIYFEIFLPEHRRQRPKPKEEPEP